MARNQKIHLHPGPEASAPPITGPTLGAVVILGPRQHSCPKDYSVH